MTMNTVQGLDKQMNLLIANWFELNSSAVWHQQILLPIIWTWSNPYWFFHFLIFLRSFTDGQSDVEVDLIAKKYVERGSSVTLICKHNVEDEKLYKVTWLKGGSKVFEYINGRQPPYRNFSVPGAEIDVS